MTLKGFSSFTFSGLLDYSDKIEDVIKKGETKKNDTYVRLNMSCKADKSRAYVEVFGIKSETVKLMYRQTQEDKFEFKEFKKKDITEEMIKNNISNNSKFVLKLNPSIGEDKKYTYEVNETFIDSYDFIVAINSILKSSKGKSFVMGGKVDVNIYKGKKSLRFKLTHLIEVLPENCKNELMVELPVVLTKNSIENFPATLEDFKKMQPAERKLPVDLYVGKYNSLLKKNELVDMSFKLNLMDFSVDNETTPLYLNLYKKILQTCDSRPLNPKKYYQIVLMLKYVNANETEVEFNDIEKQMLELGIITESLALKEKRVISKRTNELHIIRPNLGGMLEEIEIDEETDFFIEENDSEYINNENNNLTNIDL